MFPGLWSGEEEVHVSVTVCREREREEGGQSGGRKRGWGGLSSPAYRSTKDNLTLPLGLLPRLPTWHSFYFCTSPLLSVNLCVSLCLWRTPAENLRKTKVHTHRLSWLSASYMQHIIAGSRCETSTQTRALSLWNSANALTCVIIWESIHSERKEAVWVFFILLEGPLCSEGPAAYRHQPPHEVIRVGVFILGA